MSLRAAVLLLFATATAPADDTFITFEGGDGPGKGKTIVLISGDEEYRSEEALPQLAKILSRRHGFTCTVLFAIDPKDGTINPNVTNNIPGLEALAKADLVVMGLRFRDLPDDQMKHVVDYVESGRPIVGLRTSTHAFNLKSPTYQKYSWGHKGDGWDGGFGRTVLGETWVNHHGNHGSQATRGILVPGDTEQPILRGLADGDIFGPTDVYTVANPLPKGCVPLVLGEVVDGMKPTDKRLEGKKNEPMMPVAWVRTRDLDGGKTQRVFTTTMGASQDLLSEGVRRLIVNGVYWTLGLEEKIVAKSDVGLVGDYKPTPFKFNGAVKGVKPSELREDK